MLAAVFVLAARDIVTRELEGAAAFRLLDSAKNIEAALAVGRKG